MSFKHLHPRKKPGQMLDNDLLQPDQKPLLGVVALRGCLLRRRRQSYQPRQRVWNLHARKPACAGLVPEVNRQVEAHVGNMRERPSRVMGERCQDREYRGVKILPGMRLLAFIEGVVVKHIDAGRCQQRKQLV